ncbi:MAG: Phosphatidylinositol 3,5-bisphosphate-binding protein [Cirrosporium novae-zelandiae]|nr:MAG: Phosphatidylinositol 3,5-bisphosphate-binding protein [Cirrosporium novae-zelandiae]
MNTRQAIDESSGPVSLSASFNNDSTCFSVGLDSGFCVFNADPCELKVSRDFNGGIGLAEMIGRTNYLALIGGGKQPKFPQNKAIIWDDHKQTVLFTLEFRTQVCSVRLDRSRIVVVLLNSVHVYKFSVPPEKLSVFETSDNPMGLACLGSKVLAFPGRSPGQVQMVELETGNVSIIPAHGSPLRAMDLSPDGEVLATASENGTLLRIFSTSNCVRMAELRRGVDHANIFSIAISPSSSLIAVTSDKSTLHIFDLPHPHRPPRSEWANRSRANSPMGGSLASNPVLDENPSQKWGILGKIPLMPRFFSDIYSFTSAHFEIGNEMSNGSSQLSSVSGVPLNRVVKGVIGWTSDESLLIIGAGRDARWERFVLYEDEEGRRGCIRKGWKRYLGT